MREAEPPRYVFAGPALTVPIKSCLRQPMSLVHEGRPQWWEKRYPPAMKRVGKDTFALKGADHE